ncbi:MAG: aminoacetone oxidase family FAD-binding enzyme [Firmicutes bacterium]|jgi:predicted Rossmann fold flavoprotein|nr:aminoacetone oxidase family FAD-binding enzyme [Bacillota bacterium]
MSYSVAVIGGGAAGLLAAIGASEHDAEVILLERGRRLGARLLAPNGGGRSITNAGSTEHLIQSFPGKGRFLCHAFEIFSNRDMLDLLAEEGVLTKEEEGGRILPVSEDPTEVIEALEARVKASGVTVRTQAHVTGIERQEGRVRPGWRGFKIQLADSEPIYVDRVVLCTGENPDLDEDDGRVWAEQFGHTIVPPKSAIVALHTEEDWPARVAGAVLRGVEVIVRAAGKEVTRYKEDVLFTELGLAGPAILKIGEQAVAAQNGCPEPVVIAVRTDSDLQVDDWEARLQMALREHPRQLLKSLVARWWPVSLAEALLEAHSIPPEVMANQVTKAHRRQTAEILDEFRLHLKKDPAPETAMVTRGGVDVSEVDPNTMQSLKTSGLYIAGELLDIDGVNEGYTLQAAYSTGYVAGWAAATEPSE